MNGCGQAQPRQPRGAPGAAGRGLASCRLGLGVRQMARVRGCQASFPRRSWRTPEVDSGWGWGLREGLEADGHISLQDCLARGQLRLRNSNTDNEPTFPWACVTSDSVLLSLPFNGGDSSSVLEIEKLSLNEVKRLAGGDVIGFQPGFGVKIATLGVNEEGPRGNFPGCWKCIMFCDGRVCVNTP